MNKHPNSIQIKNIKHKSSKRTHNRKSTYKSNHQASSSNIHNPYSLLSSNKITKQELLKPKIEKIIIEIQKNIKELKNCYHKLNQSSNKNKHKSLLKTKSQTKILSQNQTGITQQIDDLKRSYLNTYGRDTNNLVDLYKFYKRSIDQSKCVLNSLSMQNKLYSLSINNMNHHNSTKKQKDNQSFSHKYQEQKQQKKNNNSTGAEVEKQLSHKKTQNKFQHHLNKYQNVINLLKISPSSKNFKSQTNQMMKNQNKVERKPVQFSSKQGNIYNGKQNLRIQNYQAHKKFQKSLASLNSVGINFDLKNFKQKDFNNFEKIDSISQIIQNLPIEQKKKNSSPYLIKENIQKLQGTHQNKSTSNKKKKITQNQFINQSKIPLNLNEGIIIDSYEQKINNSKFKQNENSKYYMKKLGSKKQKQISLSGSEIIKKDDSYMKSLEIDFIPLDI